MKITICGSISFMDKITELSTTLINHGFNEVFFPIGLGGQEKEFKDIVSPQEDGQRKIDLDLINKHWHKILRSDCILVANYEKKGVPGYVGGNTFLEMGFAFVSGKPIFMLNPIPDMGYTSEIQGMQPIIINNDLTRIAAYYHLSKKT